MVHSSEKLKMLENLQLTYITIINNELHRTTNNNSARDNLRPVSSLYN